MHGLYNYSVLVCNNEVASNTELDLDYLNAGAGADILEENAVLTKFYVSCNFRLETWMTAPDLHHQGC